MPNNRWEDNHHSNRFPLGRRLGQWMSFSPTQDETAAAIFRRHGGSPINPQPDEYFMPLMRTLTNIRGITTVATVKDGGRIVIGADDFK